MLKRVNTQLIHITLPKALHTRLRVRCAYENTTLQDYVSNLIEKNLTRWALPTEVARGKMKRR